MVLTSLLLNRPIPRESIELGRLVLDPRYPDHEFCQPSFRGPPAAFTSLTPTFSPDIAIQRLENFQQVLQHTRGTQLHLSLLKLLSIVPSAAPVHSSATVISPQCVIHQLRNPSTYFSAACREATVRAWLESESQRRHSSIYLICGFKVLTDAQVELARNHKTDLSVSVAVSPGMIAGGGIGVPTTIPAASDLSIGGSLSLTSEAGERIGYVAAGEQIFAVQCRKIRFSRFSARKVEKAYLENDNCWKLCLTERGGGADEDVDDGIQADVDEPLALLDLSGMYKNFQWDREEILYRAA